MNSKLFKFALSCGLALYVSSKSEDINKRMAVAGLLSQVTADFLFHPIDIVNTRTKYFYMEKVKSIQMTKIIFSTTGWRGFFRGGSVTILGSSVGGFTYFYLYKRIKESFKILLEKRKELYFLAYSLSAMISEAIVYLFYYPFDLIKTRIQTGQYDYKHFPDGVRKICEGENLTRSIKKLYTGFVPSFVYAISSATLIFFSFEICRDHYAKKQKIQSSEVSGLDYFKCTLISAIVTSFSLNFLEVYTIQKIVHGENYSLKTFMIPKNFVKATTSGLLARNSYGILYTIFYLELLKFYGLIFNVTL